MKKIIYILSVALLLAGCDTRVNKYGRLDIIDPSVPVPSPVTIKSVRNTSGGAVIKVTIPDDDNIKGVVATYERGGETVNAKISRYLDSLVVEGFADTNEHLVKVCSFNVNEVTSEAKEVTVKPLAPAIKTVHPTLSATFGGLKVLIEGNEEKNDLAVCLLIDKDLSDKGKAVKDMKWVEITTLFTASNNIKLTRRGLDAEEAIFGVYIRDRWGNISDTLTTVLTPIEEVAIPKSGFRDAALGDDTCYSGNATYYPVSSLWDGSGQSLTPHFFASQADAPAPCWLTINLGVDCVISRVATLPRIGYLIWQGGGVRDYEFWGSMNPTGQEVEGNEHNFDDSWILLGKFTQVKPSGYQKDGTVGTWTQEDAEYWNAGNDFELDENECPKCHETIHYLRVVFANTMSTYELKAKTGQVQTGEITPYGTLIK